MLIEQVLKTGEAKKRDSYQFELAPLSKKVKYKENQKRCLVASMGTEVLRQCSFYVIRGNKIITFHLLQKGR